jgi:hypothetical protein
MGFRDLGIGILGAEVMYPSQLDGRLALPIITFNTPAEALKYGVEVLNMHLYHPRTWERVWKVELDEWKELVFTMRKLDRIQIRPVMEWSSQDGDIEAEIIETKKWEELRGVIKEENCVLVKYKFNQ